MVLSKHYSRKAVIEDYRAAGVRLQWLSRAMIDRAAMTYLEAHRDEMIAKALRAIQESPALRKLAEQERRRRAKLNSAAQNASR
jgi:hypothetical protein